MPQKLQLLVAPKTAEDINSLKSFLEIQNKSEAFFLIITRINRSIRLLQEFPDLGELRENLHARVLTVPKTRYLIIFRAVKNTLQILRIYHTSQKWEITL